MPSREHGESRNRLPVADSLTQLVANLTPVVCELLEATPKKHRLSFEYEYRGDEWGVLESVTLRSLMVPSGRMQALLAARGRLVGLLDDRWFLSVSQAGQAVILSVYRGTDPTEGVEGCG